MTAKRYLLQNKDVPVLAFTCERDDYGALTFSITKHHGHNLPFGFNLSSKNSVEEWLRQRRAHRDRPHIATLREAYGCNDLEGYILFCGCIPLNDTFWVRAEDDIDLSWNDVSPFLNTHLDSFISQYALAGGSLESLYPPSIRRSFTPELSTDGSYGKCWCGMSNNDIVLFKRGSQWNGSRDYEVYSEVCAYDVGRHLCGNIVPYSSLHLFDKPVSKCPLFTSEKIGYAPIAYIPKAGDTLETITGYYDSIGEGEGFREMMVLDALILNVDRHKKNFGVLYDADTLEIQGMAPVFDNNLSFLPHVKDNEIRWTDGWISFSTSALGNSLTNVAIHCLTPAIRRNLERLRGFEFSDVVKSQWDSERLVHLEKIVRRQVENLLGGKRLIGPPYCGDDFVIEEIEMAFPKEDFLSLMGEGVSNGDIDIADFSMTFAGGDEVTVSGMLFDLNQAEDEYTIRVFHVSPSESLPSAEVAAVSGFALLVQKQVSPAVLQARTLTIRINNALHFSEFSPPSKEVVVASTLEAALQKLQEVLTADA